MECRFCNIKCQRAGRQKNGAQKYFCAKCKKYQQSKYAYNACKPQTSAMTIKLLCNGVGIRGISRILAITSNTVQKIILKTAAAIPKPPIPLKKSQVEIDELKTFIGRKQNHYWIAYAFCSDTKQTPDFLICKRNKRSLRMIINSILISGAEVIKTDGLNIYQSLIPQERHMRSPYMINYIERNNLTLRTNLKRLSRRTICFSRSFEMLKACPKIYFWRSHIPVNITIPEPPLLWS